MIGRSLSHYRITGKLGAGGMGEVYLATDTRLERPVALKVLPAEVAADPERLERLQREAKALAALDHPNIVGVFSIEEAEGVHFLTMAHIEGKTLDELIPPGGLPTKRFFELAVPLADALRAAHESGIVHRDLKPANIMIDREGRLRVLDFGLARIESQPTSPDMSQLATQAMTRVGTVLGSFPYMSPEQIEGKVADARSDIFSMGVVLYRMATGERPFRGDTAASLISSILRDTPPLVTEARKNLPGQLGRIIRRCLEKDPSRRIQSAQDLRRDLQDLAREVASGHAWTVKAPRTRGLARTVTHRLAAVAIVGALVILTGVYAWWNQRPPPAAQAPRIASLAVLPLENFTGDSEQDYLVDGMTDALIADLSKIGALSVISRTTAMRYKKTEKSLPEIARELNVDGVVEGSVMREAETLRIRASLIDSGDRRLWSDSFSRDLAGVLSLQGDIARAIAKAIDVTLTPQEESRLTVSREVDPETYQAYLRGMSWLNKGTGEGIEKGMAFLHEAVERDPGDALAYAGLALGYITVAHGPAPPKDALSKAKSAALKAVRLDANLAEGHAALGFIEGYYEWQWEKAQRSIDHALEINPSLAIAHYHDSWFHVLFGRMDDAIEAHKRAQELDPLMPLHTAWLGEVLRMVGRYDEAIAEAKKSIAIAPNFPPGHFVLGLVYLDQEKYAEAIAELEKAATAAPDWRWAAGFGYVAAGREDEARGLLAELQAQPVTPWNALWLALLHAILGDFDEAFRWLDYESPHAFVPWVGVLDWFEPLRDDPRFDDLLRRMNLPPAGAASEKRDRKGGVSPHLALLQQY